MTAETAQTILYSICAVGFVVWLIGLLFLVSCARKPRSAPAERFELAEATRPNMILGETEIEGRPAELATKAASILAEGKIASFGPVKILERTSERVAFEGATVSPNTPGLSRCVRRGEIRFASTGMDRTRAEYSIEVSGGRGLLLAGAIVQALGLVALIGGFLLIRTFVVPNENLGIRGQTVQMVQVVHFLWPPFLFGGLYRMRIRAVRGAFDTFVHNLPYTGD
jgi:hypothetical protein